jgi:succinate dehydrogenase / fumarate reductase cytochrome b subunit
MPYDDSYPMPRFKQAIQSTIGRKWITALTGVGLVVFVIVHLSGNLLLYRSDGSAFNAYVAQLHGLGPLLLLAELGLVALFGIHVANSLWIKKANLSARPLGYHERPRSKGGHSRSSLASRHMAVTGTLLLAFLILHILQFRFGPGVAEGYVTRLRGEDALDLHRRVVETFQNPAYVLIYAATMVFLGFHVRHGFWSMFQTSGVPGARLSEALHGLGLVVAVALALGFLGIPLWIYFH